MDAVNVYCDGGCSGNGKSLNHGALVSIVEVEKPRLIIRVSKYVPDTTSNRMEMAAAIEGLIYIIDNIKTHFVIVHTDSKYLVDGMSKWIKRWETNGWKCADDTKVYNRDLWEYLLYLETLISIQWVHHPRNSLKQLKAADKKCRQVIKDRVSQLECKQLETLDE